jgi:pimeloyl-ACP methyl ester carboxylesterase
MRRLSSFKEKRVLTQDGLSLYYEVTGQVKKKVLVFVHGLGGDVAAWDEERIFFDYLGYSTVALDLRGHGFSEHPTDENGYAMENFAQDVYSVIQQERLESYILIGHCFGGMVVFTFEHMFPKAAEGLVLVTTSYKTPYLPEDSLQKRVINKLTPIAARYSPAKYWPRHADYTTKLYEHDFDPAGFFSVVKHNSLKTFLSATDTVNTLDVLNKIESINVPTLIIAGKEDTVFPPEISEEIHSRIKSSEIEYIIGGNHKVVSNNPMEVSVAINNFLHKNELS